MTELITLEVSYNLFNQELPAWLGNLTKLAILGLRGNGWQGEIPTTITNLVNLRNLFLDFNQLTGDVPANFNALNLTHLFLDDNQLTGTITSVIGNMNNLLFVNLSRNQFTGVVPNFVDFAANIRDVFIRENLLTFEDILPNLATNLNHLQNNSDYSQFNYDSQAKIGVTTSFLFNQGCLLYTSPSPRDQRGSRMPSSA